mmetsp:Transcript_16913/g.29061  ORF Transcript_16913/g.29061 Transcript_16913/m.29061 type:complete len:87 (-) Transcript_16913:610-870(-)
MSRLSRKMSFICWWAIVRLGDPGSIKEPSKTLVPNSPVEPPCSPCDPRNPRVVVVVSLERAGGAVAAWWRVDWLISSARRVVAVSG